MTNARRFAVCLLGLALAGPALAQAPPARGFEHERLGLFVGTWTSVGDMQASPSGAGGTMIGTDRCQWFEGNFAVLCYNEIVGPAGPQKVMGILGYSSEEGAFTYYGTNSNGTTMTTVAKGHVAGDTWTYTSESMIGGKTVGGRYTIKVLSPSSYTFEWQTQGDDGQWTTYMRGSSTKVQETRAD